MIVRSDISSGYQAVQGIHAAIQFIFEHSDLVSNWFDISNYIALLSVSSENELVELIEKASSLDIPCSKFVEPDINNEVTAIVLAPGKASRKLCANLALALK